MKVSAGGTREFHYAATCAKQGAYQQQFDFWLAVEDELIHRIVVLDGMTGTANEVIPGKSVD